MFEEIKKRIGAKVKAERLMVMTELDDLKNRKNWNDDEKQRIITRLEGSDRKEFVSYINAFDLNEHDRIVKEHNIRMNTYGEVLATLNEMEKETV